MPSSLTPPELLHEDRPSPPELFGQDQLERHAVALAGLYRLAPDPVRGRPLLPRLDASAQELDDAYRFLSAAVTKDSPAVGSEDWLRDNHHVVQDQVREIRQDLPRKYLPGAAQACRRSVHRLSASLRVRARAHLAHGRPARSANTRRLRSRLSARRATDDRRNLGHPDHAAPGARRGAAPAGRRRRRRTPRPRSCPCLGRAADDRRARAREHHRRDAARRGRSERPAVGGLCRRAPPLAARPAVIGSAGVARAAARARSAGRLAGRDAAGRAPARGGRTAGHRQHHHDDAAVVVDRLAAVFRARQPGRTNPARGSGGRLRAHGFSNSRSLPALGRGAGPRCQGARAGRRPTGGGPGAPRRSTPHRISIARITSATTSSRAGAFGSSAKSGIRRRCASASRVFSTVTPSSAISGRSPG